MKKTILSLLASTIMLGLAGCASDQSEQTKKTEPPKDTRPMEQRLAVGMTKDEVRKALGDPSGNSVNSLGEETWTYSDHAKAFIPYYSLTGGKFHNVNVSFDKDGKVKSWASNTTGGY